MQQECSGCSRQHGVMGAIQEREGGSRLSQSNQAHSAIRRENIKCRRIATHYRDERSGIVTERKRSGWRWQSGEIHAAGNRRRIRESSENLRPGALLKIQRSSGAFRTEYDSTGASLRSRDRNARLIRNDQQRRGSVARERQNKIVNR